jgi:3-methyladenine DNA glycosylase AlkD
MTPVRTRTTLFTDYIDEVESRTITAAKDIAGKITQHKRDYLGTNNPVLGLTVPQQRQLLKAGYSFSKLLPDEQLLIWDAVWQQAKYHESKMQALFWLSSIKNSVTLTEFWPVMNKWVKFVDSWDTSDNLSSVFARILENARHIVYPTLEKWNISKNPWERRQSIVSLLYFSSSRQVVLPHNQILPLIEKLIEDPDKFVQKGVGWSLRECHSVHPVATRNFIRKHATRISAIAFPAAAEKWPPAFLAEIKKHRKKHRKSHC